MSSGGISGWQTAMLALPDLASPKSTTASAEKKADLKKSEIAPLKLAGNAERQRIDDTKAVADKKKDKDKEIVTPNDRTKVEKRQVSLSPTGATDDKTTSKDVKEEEKTATAKKRTSIVKRKADELCTDKPADGEKPDDGAKDKEREEIAPAKRTRIVSGQADEDRTQASENNEAARKKTIPISATETKNVKTLGIEETPDSKGNDEKKATTSDQTRLGDGRILDNDKKPNKKTDKKTATKKKVLAPDKTKLGTNGISDDEKKPRKRTATSRVTKPSRPTASRHYTRSGQDRGSMNYANKLNSMTNMLRRKYR